MDNGQWGRRTEVYISSLDETPFPHSLLSSGWGPVWNNINIVEQCGMMNSLDTVSGYLIE